MRLTNGEGWRLLRKRACATQAVFAARAGVSEDRLRAYEQDRGTVPSPGRCGPWDTLSPGEYCTLGRRRLGRTVAQQARRCAISRQTLIKIEADRTATALDWARRWAEDYPAPDGVAPVRIGAPSL